MRSVRGEQEGVPVPDLLLQTETCEKEQMKSLPSKLNIAVVFELIFTCIELQVHSTINDDLCALKRIVGQKQMICLKNTLITFTFVYKLCAEYRKLKKQQHIVSSIPHHFRKEEHNQKSSGK